MLVLWQIGDLSRVYLALWDRLQPTHDSELDKWTRMDGCYQLIYIVRHNVEVSEAHFSHRLYYMSLINARQLISGL